MGSDNGVGFYRQDKSPALQHWLDAVLLVFLAVAPVYASNHYTDHQLDALATRLGKIYWIVPVKNQTPAFLSNPTANAASFHPQANESFEITELVGRQEKNPYYKVKFNSGREAFIHPEMFLEELNLRITSVDPLASDRKRTAEAAEEEKKRLEWIQAQTWPRAVKESAIKRKVQSGMSTGDVRQILGKPLVSASLKLRTTSPEKIGSIRTAQLLFFTVDLWSALNRRVVLNSNQARRKNDSDDRWENNGLSPDSRHESEG